MSSSRPSDLALLALLVALAGGCDRSQPWTFRNGPTTGPERPPSILAEIYEGECGACEPRGARRYCETISGATAGARPDDLEDGATYCFVGTALDADGAAYAIGCDVVEVGQGGPIEVTLARIDAERVITRRCASDVADAGPPFDAGPGTDAGPLVGFDAGAPTDAGPRQDGGLSVGDPVVVRFIPQGPGAVYLRRLPERTFLGTLQPFREPRIRVLEASVGFTLEIDAEPDSGATLVGITGACGVTDPCAIRLTRSQDIYVRFATSM